MNQTIPVQPDNPSDPSDAGGVEVSIIVPALNEAENLPELLRRIAAVMAGRAYEVLVIDDNSTDDTPRVCAELARQYPLTLHVRRSPKGGLSGAVLHGMSMARGRILVVMDADLQHPPEHLPALIEPLGANGTPGGAVPDEAADFVLGSRYVPGARTAEKWGPLRRLNSRIATFLARPFAGRTRDPMSGFFALRRETYSAAHNLTPLGYKVGLELMCKCRVGSVREVPIYFDVRSHGQSKLTLREQFRYLEHLSRLYDFHYPRASPIAKFLIATGVSWLFAAAACLAVLPLLGPGPARLAAPVLTYPVAVLVTAAFHARYVRTQREFLVSPHPWLSFWVIAVAEWSACAAAAAWARWRLNAATPGEVFVLSYGMATVVRYVLRKEFLLDVRGLRRQPRQEELAGERMTS